MADPVDQNAPWAWIPDSWRDAGTSIADSFGSAVHNAASNSALTSLGLAPMSPVPPPPPDPTDAPAMAAFPSLAPAPVPPPVDDSIAGAPQGAAVPAAATPSSMPAGAGAIPPAFDSALAGAPGAAGAPALALAQMPTLPPPAEPVYPPMAMPVVPPGASRTPAELDPTSPAAWKAAQNAETTRLANLDPIAFAAQQAAHEQAAKESVAADTLTAARENRQKAEQNWLDYQKAAAASQAQMAQVVTDAQALAKQHVNPDPRSTFSKIRGVLAAFVGGLVAPYNGGRNVGLEAIQKEIEEGVAAQQADIANQWKGIDLRKGAATEGLTLANDMYRQGETARLGLWQAAINDLQTKQAAYDPRGTTAMNIASAVQGARAKMADIQLRMQETFGKQNLEIIKAGREQQDQVLKEQQARETARHNVADEAHANYATSVEAMRAKADVAAKNAENERFTPKVLGAMYGVDPDTIPSDMSRKEFAAWNETKGKIASQGASASEAAGKQVAGTIYNPVTGDPLTKKIAVNGKETEVPLTTDPTEAKTIKDVIAATQEFIDAASDARRALDDGPSLTSREKWAAISARLQNAKVKYIEIQKAKPSSKEMEAMGEHVFGPDFSDYTDRIKDKSTSKARLDALIDAAKRDAGTELTKAGYKGPVPILDTSRPPAAAENEIDRATTQLNQDVLKRPIASQSADDSLVLAARNDPSAGPGRDLKRKEIEKLPPDSVTRRAYDLGLLPSDLKVFDQLEKAARSSNEQQRQSALSALGDVGTNAPTGAYREYARSIMQRLVDASVSDIPVGTETVKGSN